MPTGIPGSGPRAVAEKLRLELTRANATIVELQKQLLQARGQATTDTDVFIVDHIHGNQPLPKGTRIKFLYTDIMHFFEVYADSDKRQLKIYGGTWLSIHPEASNVITLKLRD